MSILSLSQARVVSPILTSMAYGIPIQGLIGTKIMPIVPVSKRACKVIQFNRNREKYLYVTRRAPGDDILQIQSAYGDVDITLYQDALGSKLPIEQDEEAEGIVDLQVDQLTLIKTGLAMRLEADIFALVNNFAGYAPTNRAALLAATQFSNAAVNPIAQMDIATQAILSGINRLPNTVVFGGLRAFNAFKENPNVKDRIKYTSKDPITLQAVGGMLGCPTALISLADYVNPLDPNVTIPFFDNAIWMGYVPGNGTNTLPTDVDTTLIPATGANKRVPSWGYTYMRMAGQVGGNDTGLMMEEAEYTKKNRSWNFYGHVDRSPVVTGMNAGYLITNVAA
ncbi:MAG: hypothetical protein ACRCZS_08865 [Chroococcidiopsis sp.]